MAVLNTGLAVPAFEKDTLTINKSIRFEDGDSSYLSRTPGSAGNLRLWTFSCWVKRGNSGTGALCGAYESASIRDVIRFTTDDELSIQVIGTGYTTVQKTTVAKFRDPAAWYHIMVVWDSSNGVAGDRVKIYINGSLQTLTGTDAAGDEDSTTGNDEAHFVGARSSDGSASVFYDGYMAEVHYINGTACTPSDFGKEGTYGEWLPVEYTGSYGTNGYHFDFADAADMGDDESGNGNDFAETNIAAIDQMLDTPSNNFCTWNPLMVETWNSMSGFPTMKQGSLYAIKFTHGIFMGTQSIKSHKVYFEMWVEDQNAMMGIMGTSPAFGVNYSYDDTTSYGIYPYGTNKITAGAWAAGPLDNSTDDVYMFAVDPVNNKMWVGRNNTWTGDPAAGTGNTFTLASKSDGYVPWFHPAATTQDNNAILNCGQDSSFAGTLTAAGNQDDNSVGDFYYDVPAGFLALCTSNLPTPDAVPKEHFNAITYTGNGSTNAITGVGHQPGFLWIKNRASANHMWFDAKRGFNGDGDVLYIHTDAGDAQTHDDDTHVRSFDSDGFTLAGTDTLTNADTNSYAAWSWKCASAFSGTTTGAGDAMAYSGLLNADLGISIVKYLGNHLSGGGSPGGHTIPHHLGSTPDIIFIRRVEAGETGNCLVPMAGNNSFAGNGFLQTQTNEAFSSSTSYFPDPPATSSVVTLGWQAGVNGDEQEHLMICFKSVEGISKIDNYKGNGNNDGAFIHTGFAPKWVMIKNTDDTDNWYIADKAREDGTGSTEGNPMTEILNTNTDGAEYTTGSNKIDFLSNGFKCRDSASGDTNISGELYVYMAFAETPFKHTNAR